MVICRRLALLTLAVLAFSACGKKGPLLPPVSRVPQVPENIRVYQQGGRLLIEWTNPQGYVDGSSLGPVLETEIWVWEAPAGDEKTPAPPTAREMARQGRLEKRLPAAKMEELRRTGSATDEAPVYRYARPLDEEEIEGAVKAYALRARDQRKRPSTFSSPAVFEARALPLPPRKPVAEVFEDRIEIQWQAPESDMAGKKPAGISGYNVYKMDDGGVWRRLTDTPGRARSFSDTSFVFGRPARYIVRAVLSVPKSPQRFLESDDSPVLEVTPKDTFPPAAPEGLTSVSGRGFVSISWQPNREKDLDGYRVWRKAKGEADFSPLTPEPIPQVVFTDEKIEPGRTYTYAVAAVDHAGNTSPKAEISVESHRDAPR